MSSFAVLEEEGKIQRQKEQQAKQLARQKELKQKQEQYIQERTARIKSETIGN